MKHLSTAFFYTALALAIVAGMSAPFDVKTLTWLQLTSLGIGQFAVFLIIGAVFERVHEWLERKMRASDHQL